MFCDKCGKDNAENAVKCKSCGAPMPAKAFKGGFGDILSYENSGAGTVKRESAPSSVQPVAPPPAPKGNNVVGIIAIVLSAIAIAVSVVSIVLSSGGNAKDEPKTEPKTEVTTEAREEVVVPPTEPVDTQNNTDAESKEANTELTTEPEVPKSFNEELEEQGKEFDWKEPDKDIIKEVLDYVFQHEMAGLQAEQIDALADDIISSNGEMSMDEIEEKISDLLK